MIKKLLLFIFILVSINVFAATPVLSNFRIENSNKNRVYFDSNESITASNYSGFKISGKTITGISINSGANSGHYFSVSSAFDFWDNNTIRYEGGSNLMSTESIPLNNFTLSYIKNNIPEPTLSGKVYFVDKTNGSNSNSGLSEGLAWASIQKAVSVANAGDKVWIKAGNYGSENLTMQRAGSTSNPIVFEGYKNNPGDITSNYYTPYSNINDQTSLPLDSSEMPLLDGNDPDSGDGIEFFSNIDNIIFRNIQIKDYFNGVHFNNGENILFENVNITDIGIPTGASSNAFDVSGSSNGNYRFINCKVVNAEHAGWWYDGTNSLWDGCEVYYDIIGTTNFDYGTDYPYMIAGSNNITLNSKIHYKVNQAHLGHGFNFKYVSDYNLIDNCLAINTTGYKTRYSTSRYNVIKNSEAHANVNHAHPSATGINMLNDPNNNVYENMYIHDLSTGIYGAQNTEDPTTRDLAHDNIIRNSIFVNVTDGIFLRNEAVPQVSAFNNNKIYNNTFYNIDNLFSIATKHGGVSASGNEFKNNILHTVSKKDRTGSGSTSSSGFNLDYNNFYNGFSAIGTNTNTDDPQFVNAGASDFHLQESSSLIDAGTVLAEVGYDYDNVGRSQDSGHDLGAFEKKNDTNTNSVNANAGADTSICSGDNTTLTASGGGSYVWSTGDTTASITVNPTTTTTYTVTVSDGTDSDSDDVVVTVSEIPTADAGSDITICSGSDTILTANGGDTYLWNTGETTESITVNPTVNTTYSVTTSNDGCTTTATDEVIVTVNSIPNLNAGNDIEICTGSSITLTASGSDNYVWNTGETTASITVNPASTTTYSVTSSSGSCSVSDDVIVTVDDPPSVSLGADTTICFGESITLTAEGNGNFVWSTGETTSSITVNPSATTTYSVTASSSCSASDVTDEIIINVTPEITLDAGVDVVICQGENVTLTASGNNGFLWNTGETTASITVNPTSTTTYSVTSTSGNCSASDEVIVTVDSPPSVSLGADATICFGESITLTAEGNGNFVWSTGETTSSITVNPSATTTYSVTASSSCSASDVTDEIIINVTPEITLDAGADVIICQGENVTLTASGNNGFLWNTGETTASITVNPTSTTTYSVTSTSGNCSVSDEVIVTVESPPSVSLGADTAICSGESITLTAEGNGNFVWSTGATSSTIIVSPSTTTTYSVTASSSCTGSSVSDEIEITVNDIPNIDAGSDVTIEAGTNITLTANGEGSFLWNTGETTPSITVSPTVTTTYTVVATLNGSCSSEDSVIVIVDGTSEQVVAYAGEDVEICKDAPSVILTASGGDNYIWNTGETTESITVNPNETTVYTVTVSNSSSIDTDEVTIIVDEGCSGLGNRNSSTQELIAYPNPTDGLLNLEINGYSSALNISLFSLNGSLVYSEDINDYSPDKILKRQIDLSRFGKGVYFVRLTNNNTNKTKKILVI